MLAGSQRLFLFYSESRKAYSPGGDVKYITSTDAGESWSPPTVIYTHEQVGLASYVRQSLFPLFGRPDRCNRPADWVGDLHGNAVLLRRISITLGYTAGGL